MSAEWIDLDGGRARVAGFARGVDETGHQVFQIQLGDWSPHFGEFRPKWADNKTDFDIEIVKFGFFDTTCVGMPYESGLDRFSASEQNRIERLTCSLFTSQAAQKGTSPFSIKSARFMGGVHFMPGWILPLD